MGPSRPRKILALDGGGVRGRISIEVLDRIERILRSRLSRPDLRLSDWFDLIAGTSAGAITAGLLAMGHSVATVRRFYDEESRALFDPAPLYQRFHHRYEKGYFARRLREVFGEETTLGSDRLLTRLLVILRNVNTDSTWSLTNFRGPDGPGGGLPDAVMDLPLWELVRASTAAPTYFEPERIHVGGDSFLFVDGSLAGYSNPAFQSFLVATMERYGLAWPTGPDRLLVVSVGTGRVHRADHDLVRRKMHLWYQKDALPWTLVGVSKHQQDLLCRVFGDCRAGEPLDEHVGTLIGESGPVASNLFTYLRYDVSLTPGGLAAVGCSHLDPERLQRLDDVAALPELGELGAAVAERKVSAEHFAEFLREDDGDREARPAEQAGGSAS